MRPQPAFRSRGVTCKEEHMMMRIVGMSLAAAACLAFAQPASAGGRGAAPASCGTQDSCADCGGCGPCQRKVCQVVCGTRTITKYCWCVECEEFCAPLPGCGPLACACSSYRDRCGRGDCDSCGDPDCDRQCDEKCPIPPKCGPVRSRKRLVKKEYECEVPVYECVVKYVCPGCCAGEEETVPEVQEESAPPPPPVPSKEALRPAPLPRLYSSR